MWTRFRLSLIVLGAIVAADVGGLVAQTLDTTFFHELRWRSIGPFRGGRTKAAVGVPSRPGTFYIGATNGGVWKSTDYGQVWRPIFDAQPTGSIGAIAVAPSAPDVIYVGSGEGLQRPDLSVGDGIYKSVDGGRNWAHLGLRDAQQITQIVVHPKDPDHLFVAVLGHPYGPNAERGLYRSVDGGSNFTRILYLNEHTGAGDVVLDPIDSNIIYASLWETRHAPWENGVFTGPGSGLYKSIDGGTTWRQLTNGLPTFKDGLGRIGITIAPSLPSRLYATVEVGGRGEGAVYRSDDAGGTWRRLPADGRVAQRAYDFAEVKVDPRDPNTVYTGSIVVWKSIDGGQSWTAIRGAPGGDDYHRIWIDPTRPQVMLIASDQGAIITVNGGATWSSWYNQPTAQFYHVSTDNAYPYRVCGGQQESGSACVASRGNDGQITFREWHPVGVEEYGYVAPDPKNPDIVYGGKVTRYDRRTGQVKNVAPKLFRSEDYRTIRTMPLVFSPIDSVTLYFASNTLWKTVNGGEDWTRISPDLTRSDSSVSPSIAHYGDRPEAKSHHPGVIYTIAPSLVSTRWIWVGTDDGLIHLTRDAGSSWTDVTPPELVPWAKVSMLDASPFDTLTAYAAINTLRLDDLRPHIYRTRDGGKSWTHITNGIPDGGSVNTVRADPVRPGLLYAGTERTVYVSFDDGDHWLSLRNNLPATSIRDLVVKDDDLVIGTHGRGFWILDDVTPLRQVSTATLGETAHLYRPELATRVRWNMNTDTPLPYGEPAGQNPPDGAVLHYWIGRSAARNREVTLEILDRSGVVVRRYASTDPPEQPLEGQNVPDYWVRPPQRLLATPGLHRFVWDLRHERPAAPRFSYPIAGIPWNTVPVPKGSWVLPGEYTVRLTVSGRQLSQPLTVRLDPRVTTPLTTLRRQYALSRQLDGAMRQVAEARESAGAAVPAVARYREIERDLTRLHGDLARLFGVVEQVDDLPTTEARAAIRERLSEVEKVLERVRRLESP